MDIDSITSSSSSSVTYHYNLNHYRENMSIANVMDDNTMNWDLFTGMWNHAVDGYLKVDMKATPVMITEKPFNSQAARYK